MMKPTPKYIFENGVMKLNPNYNSQTSTYHSDPHALAIVSSTNDIAEATHAQIQATGKPMQLSDATVSSMQVMQDQEFLNKFQAPNQVQCGQILDGISNIFARYEVPIGLLNKLLVLSEYKLNFIIDDSGSMTLPSDVNISEASLIMKQKLAQKNTSQLQNNNRLTRWEEAEDRLHVMMDMLAYIPTDTIQIRFLNRNQVITLDHKGKSAEQFAQYAHQQIMQAFNISPQSGTPIYSALSTAFNSNAGSTMHYLFTDGVPTDASLDMVKSLVLNRKNPQMSPLTFMSCSNDESEVAWMKEVEQDAPYTAELDNFVAERKEVISAQGQGFPFSKGFWMLCQLVAAINPYDLDAMDEPVPFTKLTIDNLMGRRTTEQEYQFYFKNNPHSAKYNHLYMQFARENIMAHQIVKNSNQETHINAPNSSFGLFSGSSMQGSGNQTTQNNTNFNANPPTFQPPRY